MNALLVHSIRMVRHNGLVYAPTQFSSTLWQKYLKHFEKITILTRISHADSAPIGWAVSSCENVSFVELPDSSLSVRSMFSNLLHKKIDKEVLNSSAVIIRQSEIGWIAANKAIKHNKPYMVEVIADSFKSYWYYGSILGKIFAFIANHRAKKYILSADCALYVTKNYLQNKYPSSGVQTSVSDVKLIQCNESVLRNRLEVISKMFKSSIITIKLGIIGDFYAKYKGIDIAIKALNILNIKGYCFKLHILGEGKLKHKQKFIALSKNKDDLSFDGSLSNPELVVEWLDSIDLYLQPSYTEGLPRSLIEAMSRALPCIASKVGGIVELLSRSVLHEPGDFKSLANIISHLVTDEQQMIIHSRRNYYEALNYEPISLNSKYSEALASFKKIVETYDK